MTERVARTDDHRFDGLPGFAFRPHYRGLDDARFGQLRMHYVDEGPRDAPVVLMLHGNPTWSFLYRKVIGPVAAAGYRVVAPDHIGFGRSDKPIDRSAYSYQGFVDWLRQFVERLELQRITLVAQDWGGPIGLRVLSEQPERFDAVLATNTLLPNCEPPPRGIGGWPGPLIEQWVETCRTADDLPVAEVVAGACATRPADEILAAYDAPFPNAASKAGVLAITGLIPTAAGSAGIVENRRAWDVLEHFDKPFRTAFSDGDPSTLAWERIFQTRVPGARGQPHVRIPGAGHFVQEDQGDALARVLLDLLGG